MTRRSYSRNYTFIALRRLKGARRLAFIAWWWLVGERASYGVATARRRSDHGPGEDRARRGELRRQGGRGARVAERPVRLLMVASHPVQYASPQFRSYAEDPRLDLTVAYCSLAGAEAMHDPDFDETFAWDVPLLDGYRWRLGAELVAEATAPGGVRSHESRALADDPARAIRRHRRTPRLPLHLIVDRDRRGQAATSAVGTDARRAREPPVRRPHVEGADQAIAVAAGVPHPRRCLRSIEPNRLVRTRDGRCAAGLPHPLRHRHGVLPRARPRIGPKHHAPGLGRARRCVRRLVRRQVRTLEASGRCARGGGPGAGLVGRAGRGGCASRRTRVTRDCPRHRRPRAHPGLRAADRVARHLRRRRRAHVAIGVGAIRVGRERDVRRRSPCDRVEAPVAPQGTWSATGRRDIVIDVGDVDGYAQALERLAQDPELLARLGKGASARLDGWGLEQNREAVVAASRELARR